MTGSKSSKTNKSIETRNRIIKAARELFYEYGYEETKIREICKKAQLQSQGSFYRYFIDKLSIVNTIQGEFMSSVVDYDKNYINEADPLVHFLVIQYIILSKLILNPKNSIYYSEFEKYTTFDFYDKGKKIVRGYRELFQAVMDNLGFKFSQEDMEFYVSSYSTTLGKTIFNINAGCFKMKRETAVKRMQIFFPQLIGYPKDVLDNAYKKSKTVYNKLPKDKMDKIVYLVENEN